MSQSLRCVVNSELRTQKFIQHNSQRLNLLPRVWLKNSISYNSCQYSFVIASVGFNIDRVTTQHTPKCVENCSDRKVSYNCLSNFYQIFCNLGYNSENNVFFSTLH